MSPLHHHAAADISAADISAAADTAANAPYQPASYTQGWAKLVLIALER
jgi:hypothetical protein